MVWSRPQKNTPLYYILALTKGAPKGPLSLGKSKTPAAGAVPPRNAPQSPDRRWTVVAKLVESHMSRIRDQSVAEPKYTPQRYEEQKCVLPGMLQLQLPCGGTECRTASVALKLNVAARGFYPKEKTRT